MLVLQIDAVQQAEACGCAEYALAESLNCRTRITMLVRIDKIVRFQQDLIVLSINAGVGMVMTHQIGDPFPLLLRQPRIGKKGPHQ